MAGHGRPSHRSYPPPLRPFSLVLFRLFCDNKIRHVRILAVLLGGSCATEEDRYRRLFGGVAREGVDPWPPHEAGEEGRAPGDDRSILVAERLCRRCDGGGAVFRQARARASVGTGGFDDHGRGGGAGDASDVMSTLR